MKNKIQKLKKKLARLLTLMEISATPELVNEIQKIRDEIGVLAED